MLFNSAAFLFGFLPAFLLLFKLAERLRSAAALIILVLAASVVFYALWDPRYLLLLGSSIVFNFGCGQILARANGPVQRRTFLTFAIGCDLAALFWFKYANFAFTNLQGLGIPNLAHDVILPLGISFFTFTQIAFLCDVHAGKAREFSFSKYALFVTYFPHLIAGPIIHHAEVMPQFGRMKITWQNAAVGFSCFFIGLAKKNLLADSLAPIADAVFRAPVNAPLSFVEGWMGALAYAMQLYFDFSGYSDMAIGLSVMLGVQLPANFNSPYKATSLIVFWQRWHMTLSRFLRDYLYVPLGGNRKGEVRRYINLLVTMVLGGIWHGAGWTFLVWGSLHGLALAFNHGWRSFVRLPDRLAGSARIVGWAITFLFVVAAWVPFRASTFAITRHVWSAMVHGQVILPASWQNHLGRAGALLQNLGLHFTPDNLLFTPSTDIPLLLGAMIIAFACPNTQQIMQRGKPVLGTYAGGAIQWRPNIWYALAGSLLATAALLCIFQPSVFIYFQF